MSMYRHEFTGRKPSKASVLKAVNRAIKDKHNFIEIVWGENRIILEKDAYPYERPFSKWMGHGWIGRIGGDDLAQELNPKALRGWDYVLA